jgi:hypothetical protein
MDQNTQNYLTVETMKNIPISKVHYEMLVELSKKSRSKPGEYVEVLIQVAYARKK